MLCESIMHSKILKMQEKLEKIHSNNNHYDHFVDCPEIDFECQKIGAEILSSKKNITLKDFNHNTVAIITSFILNNGGHTRQIENYIDIYQKHGKECVIIVSNKEDSDKEIIEKFLSRNIKILFCYSGSIINKIGQLQDFLIETRAEQTIVLTGVDLVLISALQPTLVDKLYWNLNCDHSISLGLHIPYITKIMVFRAYLMHYLHHYIKIDKQKLCLITLSKNDTISDEQLAIRFARKNDKIITASCTSTRTKINEDYIYKYSEIVPEILKITKGKHMHIGDISKKQIKDIQQKLQQFNIPQDSFVLVNHTSNFPNFLIDNKVDILIGTFPVGGGLVSVEAMMSGVKIICHEHAYSYLYNTRDMIYPEAFFWSTSEELYNHIKSLNIDQITNEGLLARKFYQTKLSKLEQRIQPHDIVGEDCDYENIRNLYSYQLDLFNLLVLKTVNTFDTKIYIKKILRKIKIFNITKAIFKAITKRTTN